MSPLHVFIILQSFQYCLSHLTDTEKREDRIYRSRSSRGVETVTTILLDDEAYSLAADVKPPNTLSNGMSNKKNKGHSSKINHHLKQMKVKKHSTSEGLESKINSSVSLPKNSSVARNKGNPPRKHKEKKLLEGAHKTKRKIQKRQFENHNRLLRRNDEINPLQIKTNEHGLAYRFVPTPSTSNPINNDFDDILTEYSLNAESSSEMVTTSDSSYFSENPVNFQLNTWRSPAEESSKDIHNFEDSLSRSSSSSVSTNFVEGDLKNHLEDKRNSDHSKPQQDTNFEADDFENHPEGKRNSDDLRSQQDTSFEADFTSHPEGKRYLDDSSSQQDTVMGFYRNENTTVGTTTASWVANTVYPVRPVTPSTVRQVDIVERNLPKSPKQSEHKSDEGGDEISRDESEIDDTVISFEGECDHTSSQTCWMQREVGDVLTLTVKIVSSMSRNSFQVRWMKVYHAFESKKGKPLEIAPAKLPWNMVSGSEGRELRLNPVTNSDIDPNCIVAKVFQLKKHRGRTLFTQLKKLTFRIDVPIIDMGKLYAGEELSINIENFISLPERGNLLLDWSLETKPHQYESLPSNIKVSNSGRSIILKELRKGRIGVLSCVVYSANRYAVAKRRFNILKITEDVKRRSTVEGFEKDSFTDLSRSRRCRHIIRRSQEKAMQRFEEGKKPKSRKKRFKRMESINRQSEIDCEPLMKKAYSRWVRSLFEDSSTEDPRLMPLEQLFKLSEEGDGTLDDLIPHEVHYVQPKVRVLSGTSRERSVDHSSSRNCTVHADCGINAVCVTPEDQANSTGYCNCLPDFYDDGFTCRKIPPSSHREKRLRRSSRGDFVVPQHLFYLRPREAAMPTAEIAELEDETKAPKVLAFEEEESFLLSDCIDDKDCSMHASCIQPTNGHPFCKCRPGFRGNGIFCWEIIDYVPPEEHFVAEDPTESSRSSRLSDMPEERLPGRAPEAEELGDE